jgi:hypothetical protein
LCPTWPLCRGHPRDATVIEGRATGRALATVWRPPRRRGNRRVQAWAAGKRGPRRSAVTLLPWGVRRGTMMRPGCDHETRQRCRTSHLLAVEPRLVNGRFFVRCRRFHNVA